MTKFKVGDKVRFIEDYMDYKKGDIVEVEGFWSEGINYFGKGNSTGCYFSRVELVETKPTKNQRITSLENEVAELKLIVHELRDGRKTMRDVMNKVLNEPSTPTVEDIIEFEGKQYRKVDREAREGDYVSVSFENGKCFKPNKLYGPAFFEDKRLRVKADPSSGGEYEITQVYHDLYGRTPETVDVYELMKEGLNPQIPIVDETIEPLTPNQQRAAIIEKAKKFIEEKGKGFDFSINQNKRIIAFNIYTEKAGFAKCNPSDVFNEHIGKAIALGRALGLDVSEFEQAVQPSHYAVGQIGINSLGTSYPFKVIKIGKGEVFKKHFEPYTNSAGDTTKPLNFEDENYKALKIINDTNAKYEVSSNE